jgi:TRAP-type mannitol/chloroaromatic compound transport system permease small subunit
VTLLLIGGTWEHFYNAWDKGDSSMDIGLPQWPSKLVVPLMLVVLLARLALQLWGCLRMLRDPQSAPLAVSRVESAAEHARREIEETEARIGEAERKP